MKTLFWNRIGIFVLVLVPVSLAAQALPDNPAPAPKQDGGWSRLQNLARGAEISVARSEAYPAPCRFAGATDKYLFCDSLYSGREYRFDRAEVGRVRMDDKRRNVHILIAGLTAAGFIWGVAKPPAEGVPRGLAALAGAGLGAFAGVVTALPVALLIPGRTVFHQSLSKSNVEGPHRNSDSGPDEPGTQQPAP